MTTSCQEKESLSLFTESKEFVTFPTENSSIVVPVENGVLRFPDLSTYLKVEDAVSSNSKRQITEEQLDKLERNTSFHSMRRYLNSQVNPYLYGDMSFDKLLLVVSENEGLLYMHNDLPFNVFADRTQRALLNKQGAVIIERDKIIYRKDREIHLPLEYEVDFDNLPLESDPKKGVIVVKAEYTPIDSQEKSMICNRSRAHPDQIQRLSEGPEIDRRRVTSLGGVRVGKILVRNQAGFLEPNAWRYWYKYYSEQKSWARAAIGNSWRQGTRSITDLNFKFGVGITSNSGGMGSTGTGWMQKGVRTIVTSSNPYNANYFVTRFIPGDLDLIYDYDLTYVTSGVRDEDNEAGESFTFACCPWTCEELGYDDF